MKKITFLLVLLLSCAYSVYAQSGLKSYYKISDGTGGFPADTLTNSDLFGYAVEGIGDLNGDGIEDLAVNAYLDDEGYTDAGAVWILFLNLDGGVSSYQKIANNRGGFGNELGNTDVFGNAIENIGDLNGDGVTDLAVGAMLDDDGGSGRGAIYILFMNTDGTVNDYQKISDTQGSFDGVLEYNDFFGTSIANLGDINGDGVTDLAVGTYHDEDGGSYRGAVWILFMNADGTVADEQKISDTQGNFEGVLDFDDRFGYGVESIGDLNQDGVTDIVVGAFFDDDGATNTGAIWVLFLQPDGTVDDYQKISADSGSFSGDIGGNDLFGISSQYMGDMDGDGYTNLLVGAKGDDDGGTDRGAIWNLNLDTDGTVVSYQKISDTSATFTGNLTNSDNFGSAVGIIGDLNNDGLVEFVVGANSDDDGGTNRGAVYQITFNGNKSIPSLVKNVFKIADGTGGFPADTLTDSDLFGYAVEGIGDLDGDGIEDLAVNAYLDDQGYSNAGAVWILFLNSDGSVKDYQKIANNRGGFGDELGNTDVFGCAIENIGDLNGDGVTDLAVGAMLDDDGGSGRGAIYILFMNTDGTVNDYQKISDTQGSFDGVLEYNDFFGTSIANLGDIDGDGVTDLAVGTYHDEDGGSYRGAVWILFMNTDGTVADEQKISDTEGYFEGVLGADDRFGYGVEAIGDLNQDGVTDLAVGAIYDDDGATNTGAVWILFLDVDGTVLDYQKISADSGNFNGDIGGTDLFGLSTQYLGDVDGDGYPNLLVTSKGDDDGGTDRGALWNLNLATDGTVASYQKISEYQGGFSGYLTDSDGFGSGVSLIGDLDNDGALEFAVGAQNDDEGGANRGAVYILSMNLVTPFFTGVQSSIHNTIIDSNYNWSYAESYDEDTTIISVSKQYIDELGRPTQSMAKNFDKNKFLATQTVYDKYGRPVLNTMAAPIGDTLRYVDDFITNTSGIKYSYLDFDMNPNAPVGVGSTQENTLGYYYSDNSEEDFQATSSYPFSRVEYMADPTGRVKRSSAPGENFKMGSGHEQRVFYMYTGGELDRAFGVDSSFYCEIDSANRLQTKALANTQIVAEKTISVDAEGKIAISFVSDGLTIASCVSGMTPTPSVPEQSVSNTMLYNGTQSVDIHLPAAKYTSLKLPLPEYHDGETGYVEIHDTNVIYTIMDLEDNTILELGMDYTVNSSTRYVTFVGASKHRFLRISFVYSDYQEEFFEGQCCIFAPDATVEYKLDYSHFTANYYDLAGRLRMNVSPKGFDYSVNGKHTEFSKYDYDPYGQLIAQETPDEGLTEYLYSDEGAVRFSQNAQQSDDNKFSYVRYDEYNRSIESGEYDEYSGYYLFQNYYDTTYITTNNVQKVLNDVGFDFNDSYCADQKYIAYDLLVSSDEIPSAYTYKSQYPQHNLKGRVSKTWNENNQTWYSYDYVGRTEYTIQEILDSEFDTARTETVKTVEYTYAPVTSVLLKEDYQKNHSAERVTTHYTYNSNQQLIQAAALDNAGDTLGQAAFEYYVNGQLKRKELGGNLQGLDYVYTLHGQLKSINHPSLYENYDPGQDGKTGTTNANFEADLFGFALDYYENDYTRTGSNITSSVNSSSDGYNNGLVKASRWRIKDKNQINATTNLYTESETDKELMYQYVYDDFYRLSSATFGVFDNDATSNAFTDQDDYKVYGTNTDSIIDYDIIGNITNLRRNGFAASDLLMDDLAYTYGQGASKLDSIEDRKVGSAYTNDFEANGQNAFSYNNLGQMTASVADGIDAMAYFSNGQVKEVINADDDTTRYYYDERGIKIKSKFTDYSSGIVTTKWFITDASGAMRSVYEKETGNSIKMSAQVIYAGGRLGIYDTITDLLTYEHSDHLGNVRVTFRDTSTSSTPVLEMTSWSDYYPFGEVMVGRHSGDDDQLYGYQGQEKVGNNSKWYNFQLRMYNPSLGRWNTIDPYSQFYSPYLAMGNDPISYIDPDGGQTLWSNLSFSDIWEMNNRLSAQSYMGTYGPGALPDGYALFNFGIDMGYGGGGSAGIGGGGALPEEIDIHSYGDDNWMNDLDFGTSAEFENPAQMNDPFQALMDVDINGRLNRIYANEAREREDREFATKHGIDLPEFTVTEIGADNSIRLGNHIRNYLRQLDGYNGPMPAGGGGDLFYHSTHSLVYDGQTRTGSKEITLQAGQIVKVEVKNHNVLPAPVTIGHVTGTEKALLGTRDKVVNHGVYLLPMQTKSLTFSNFGNEPRGWKFNFTSGGDAGNITINFYSTWVPGMPNNPPVMDMFLRPIPR